MDEFTAQPLSWQNPPDGSSLEEVNAALTRTLAAQNRALQSMMAMCLPGCPPGPGMNWPCPPWPCPPWPPGPSPAPPAPDTINLWGGPYPLGVGSTPPTQVKVWFNTVTGELMVWNWQTVAWQQAATTVVIAATAPSGPTLGMLWLDSQPKLWIHIDDWRELTAPLPGVPVPTASPAPFAASETPPQTPAVEQLWFTPSTQDLRLWTGLTWTRIGQRVLTRVRFGNYANTWNAGGNRSQSAAAGDILFLSGIRGIDPTTQQQLPGPGPQNAPGTVPPNTAANGNARIDQIYQNIKTIAEAEGLTLYDCYGLDTYMCSAAYIGPTATQQALPQFWGTGPYPCRTHIVMLQMSGADTEAEFGATVPGWPARGDIVEVTALFHLGRVGRRKPNGLASEVRAIPGVQVGTMPAPAMAEIPTPPPPSTAPQRRRRAS